MANYDSLQQLISNNPIELMEIPPEEPIYFIDLSTRTIDGPSFVGVKEEHNAELIYFKVDRGYDLVDLAGTSCVVQYETINKSTGKTYQGVYVVPAYDITSFENYIIFAWDISKSVTQSATDIKYNIRFFQVNDNNEIIFNLNTLTTTTKVLDSLYFSDLDDITTDDTKWANLLEQLTQLYNKVKEEETLYWEEA